MLSVAVQHRLGDFLLDAAFESGAGLTALFGRSGSGKTSLVNAIAGLIRPERGRILVDGAVLTDTARRVFVPARQRKIGYVFQEGRLFPHLTVRQNLLYGRWFASRRGQAGEVEHVIDLLGIAELLARRPANLSGGEKQRVAIGRALLAQPRLLVMDEPLASLDEARKTEILPYIERLRDEFAIPIVYVSHAIAEVTRLATTMVVMSEGRVAAVGPTAEIMSRIGLFPLTGQAEAGAILSTRVAEHDTRFGLTTLRTAAGDLRVPYMDLRLGAQLRVRIRARDVMIALQPPQGLSALNILPGTVAEIGETDGPSVDMRLDCAGQPLIARLTRRSVESLGLVPGRRVYAVIKSIAFDHQAFGGAAPGTPGADADTRHG
ncbi:MAG: molybdenum ABC transporter ATP-binding protein [Alphaproteobacteria bacterium]|jgi:molybdate transport system ATP-binding protein|nr:MAG: molybdenum ABC transporter ATP-binding protein [Alphaproteobacteria bacterium]TMK36686.1 MAG: molybdenum ABC transporter ATP-binding protein [Alphaproteobacteria bacterium]